MSGHPDGRAPFREVEVDEAALEANLALLRADADGRELVADLGANAWGHGLELCAEALGRMGQRRFAATRLDEAARLLAAVPGARVATLQHAPGEDFAEHAALGVEVAVRGAEELERAAAAGIRRLILVAEAPGGLPAIPVDERPALLDRARELGAEAVSSHELRRVGAELFGLDAGTGIDERLRPALRFWAPIVAVKQVGPDEGVSYGFTYRTREASQLALVSLGYADGVARIGGNRFRAEHRGAQRTVAGRIAMDAFVLDLGVAGGAAIGDEVTLLGDPRRGEPSAAAQAERIGSVAAALATRITPRPARRLVRRDDAAGDPAAPAADAAASAPAAGEGAL